MTYTSIPSVKGQVTIPSKIREKYNINQNTPIILEDKGKGIITMKVMQLVDHDAVSYYENSREVVLGFKNGIDPQALIDEIQKIDG